MPIDSGMDYFLVHISDLLSLKYLHMVLKVSIEFDGPHANVVLQGDISFSF